MPDAPYPGGLRPGGLRLSDPGFHEAGAVRFREDRDAGAVLASALRLAVAEGRPLLASALAIAGPMYLAAALARIVGGAVAGGLLGSVVDVAAGVLLASAVFGYLRLYLAGAPAEVADVWDAAKPLLGPVLWVTLAGVLALVGLAVPAALVVGAVASASVPLAGVLGVVAVAGFVVFVLPVFAVAYVAVPLDGLGVGAAYRRALGLVREQRGRVLGTMALVALLGGFVLIVVAGSVGTAVGEATAAGGPASALASAALSLVVLPVSVVTTLVWCLLYGSLVERAEGASLGEGLDAIAAAASLGEARHETRRDADRAGARPSDALGDVLDEADRHGAPRDAPSGGFRGGGFAEGGPADPGFADRGPADREP